MKAPDWDALHRAALDLSESQTRQTLQTLARNGTLAAVLAFIERDRAAWEDAVADQRLAGDPGKLTHAAGSLHAVRTLTARLRQACLTRSSTPSPTPAD